MTELERCGSLTAAADKLCLTQSALSHSIKKLEQQFGAALWQKQGRSLRFTQAGEHVLRSAKRLLPQLEQLDASLLRYAAGQKALLRIGMECHPCYRWLLRVLEVYLQSWAEVDVDVRQRFQFGGLAALFNYEIDMLVTPDPLRKEGIVYEPVFAYEQVLVVAKEHELAECDFVEAEQLADQCLFSYPVESSRLDIFSRLLVPAGISPRQHKHVEATEIMMQLVAAGRGVAALPRWLADEFSQSLNIKALSLGQYGIDKNIYLGFRCGEQQQAHVQALLALAKKTE